LGSYAYYTDVLANITRSSVAIAEYIKDGMPIAAAMKQYTNIDVTPEEEAFIASWINSTNPYVLAYSVSSITSKHARIGWTTHGHTGLDVNVYSNDAERISGNMLNTNIGEVIAEFLDLDLE
jgi:alkaline phosphatase